MISPLVYLNFLLFLSYTRLGENHRRIQILEELHTLVYYDDGYHILARIKAISWEILGVCQHIIGDYQNALISLTECEKCIPIFLHMTNLGLLDANKERRKGIKMLLNKMSM